MKSQYRKSIAFTGDRTKVFEFAIMALTSVGFRLEAQSSSSLQFTGPGMNSSRENPLTGASLISLSVQEDELTLEAELGGLKRIRQVLIMLPAGLALLFLVLFGFLFRNRGFPFILFVSILPLSPWLILTPVLSHVMQKRTHRALDTFLHNIGVAAHFKETP